MSSIIQNCGKVVSIVFETISRIIIRCEDRDIRLTATGDCSHSVFKVSQNTVAPMEAMQQMMVGNCVTSIAHQDTRCNDNELRLFNGNVYSGDESGDDCEIVHLYHIKLDNDGVFPIYMVHYSNGYYEGQLDIAYSQSCRLFNSNVQLLNPQYFATIIMGHSGSGKTTYIRNHYEESDTVHIMDDCMFCSDNFMTLNSLNVQGQECSVVISDPRLCAVTLFIKLMRTLSTICSKDNIRIVYFANDFRQSYKNRHGRFPNSEWSETCKYKETLDFIQTIECDKMELPVYK